MSLYFFTVHSIINVSICKINQKDYAGENMNRSDEKNRCSWVNLKNEKYVKYHDEEWGVPVKDDRRLFEMLVLESFQAGLSWECVLNKREAFREAFDNFDVEKVGRYDEEKIESLIKNENIIRNRRKIEAAVKNAGVFKEISYEYSGFYNYLSEFSGGRIIYENDRTESPLSDEISKDLKKRGMSFVGSTVIYSYLQAVGIIYSHEEGCYLSGKKH